MEKEQHRSCLELYSWFPLQHCIFWPAHHNDVASNYKVKLRSPPKLFKNFEIRILAPNGCNSSLLLVLGFSELDSQISLLILLALFIQTTFSRIFPPSQHVIQNSTLLSRNLGQFFFSLPWGEFRMLEIEKARFIQPKPD